MTCKGFDVLMAGEGEEGGGQMFVQMMNFRMKPLVGALLCVGLVLNDLHIIGRTGGRNRGLASPDDLLHAAGACGVWPGCSLQGRCVSGVKQTVAPEC